MKPSQKADHGGFARARPAYDSDPSAGRNVEPNVVKHRLILSVSERYVSVTDGPDSSKQTPGTRMFDDFGYLIEEKKGALRTSEMTLQTCDFTSDDFQWCIKLCQVSHH